MRSEDILSLFLTNRWQRGRRRITTRSYSPLNRSEASTRIPHRAIREIGRRSPASRLPDSNIHGEARTIGRDGQQLSIRCPEFDTLEIHTVDDPGGRHSHAFKAVREGTELLLIASPKRDIIRLASARTRLVPSGRPSEQRVGTSGCDAFFVVILRGGSMSLLPRESRGSSIS
jgi:hypothetical protein